MVGGFSLKRTNSADVEQIIIFILAQILVDLLHTDIDYCHMEAFIILIFGARFAACQCIK